MQGPPYKVWQCRSGFIYNEEEGAPDEGRFGTRWEDGSEDCKPICGTPKSDFDMIEL